MRVIHGKDILSITLIGLVLTEVGIIVSTLPLTTVIWLFLVLFVIVPVMLSAIILSQQQSFIKNFWHAMSTLLEVIALGIVVLILFTKDTTLFLFLAIDLAAVLAITTGQDLHASSHKSHRNTHKHV